MLPSGGGGGGTPGGANGQVQFNNSGVFGGFTVSGDGTLNPSTGAITITKTNGAAFSALATLAPGTGVATALGNAANTPGGLAIFAGAPAALPSGNVTLSLSNGYAQYINNVGAFGITAPADLNGEIYLRVYNLSGAGAVTFTGFYGSNRGDNFDTTNGHIFDVYLRGQGGYWTYDIKGPLLSNVWTPASIPGLLLWFDPSDPSNYIISSGASISQWNDLSGNANHLTQGTGANQFTVAAAAQNGLNTLAVAAASSQVMQLTTLVSVTAYSAFVVWQKNSGQSMQLFGDTANSHGSLEHYGVGGADNYTVYNASNNGLTNATAFPSTAYHQISALTDGSGTVANSAIYVDGTSVGPLTSFGQGFGAFKSLGYGDGIYADGHFGEIVLYNSKLSSANQLLVQAYLKAKWGTP